MPTQATIKKIGVNPFAVCAAQGLKRGTPKGERCIEHVTKSAKRRVGVKRRK